MTQPCRRPPLAHLQGASPDVLHEVVVAKDSYETPSWVWSHYVQSEALTVDVHASAFNAVAPRYITKADDPASLDEPLPRAKKLALGFSVPPPSVWPLVSRRPAAIFAPQDARRRAVAQPCVREQVQGHRTDAGALRARGARARVLAGGTAAPLLFQDVVSSLLLQTPCACTVCLHRVLTLRHFSFRFHTYVQHAHEVHYLRDKVAFLNPFMGKQGEHQTPLIVAIWRAGIPSEVPPRWSASLAAPSPSQSPADLLRVRRCRACGKWRLLPRHQATEPAAGAFECRELWDARRASCDAGHVVCSWV